MAGEDERITMLHIRGENRSGYINPAMVISADLHPVDRALGGSNRHLRFTLIGGSRISVGTCHCCQYEVCDDELDRIIRWLERVGVGVVIKGEE